MKKPQERNSCALKTSIGGQALMEGIMMKGPKKSALAVRNTKGEIVVEEFETKGVKRPAICRWPLIRGIFGYIDSMVIGYKCLMRSAELSGLEDLVEESPKKKKKREAAERARQEKMAANGETVVEAEIKPTDAEENQPAEEGAPKEKKSGESKLPAWVMTALMVVSVVLGVAFGLGLFIYLPTKIYELMAHYIGFLTAGGDATDSILKSLIEATIRIIMLVGYMLLITLMKDIRRTFMYHGAEHKTIFCYEAGLPLTVENIREQRRFHPRCGTSFLILMLIVSIFISFFIDPIALAITGEVLPAILRTAVKILLLPLIVGVGYELIKLAGRHDNLFTRIISAPGMWLQHITVFEPTDDMIECAIAAMKEVIPEDGSDNW